MASSGEIPSMQVPTHRLEDEAESAYVRRMMRILRSARLNAHYPDSRRVSQHVQVLAPERHRGLYDGLDVDVRSGLPSYKEWTRAQTDVRLAEDQLRQLGPRRELERKADAHPEDIYDKQLHKHDYYSDVRNTLLAPLGDMQVALRRVEPDRPVAHFHVVLDKLDASGLFVRYSIDLAQNSDEWGSEVVRVDDREVAEHTEEFQSLIYKFTSLDSQFTFAKLATMPGLKIERVVKGVIGPVYFPWTNTPDAVSHLVDENGFLATFSLDMAAFDVAEDRNNDPLSDELVSRIELSEEGKKLYRKSKDEFGYRVFRDRKFVAPRAAVRDVREFCRERGTKNIVYGF